MNSTQELDGYAILAVYYHFFIPRSLKLYSVLYKVKLEELKDIIESRLYEHWLLGETRRWLQRGEAPYPGYCRAPGSVKCLPVLCNCEKLTEIWNKMNQNKGKG